jgi:hypothetical protein
MENYLDQPHRATYFGIAQSYFEEPPTAEELDSEYQDWTGRTPPLPAVGE